VFKFHFLGNTLSLPVGDEKKLKKGSEVLICPAFESFAIGSQCEDKADMLKLRHLRAQKRLCGLLEYKRLKGESLFGLPITREQVWHVTDDVYYTRYEFAGYVEGKILKPTFPGALWVPECWPKEMPPLIWTGTVKGFKDLFCRPFHIPYSRMEVQYMSHSVGCTYDDNRPKYKSVSELARHMKLSYWQLIMMLIFMNTPGAGALSLGGATSFVKDFGSIVMLMFTFIWEGCCWGYDVTLLIWDWLGLFGLSPFQKFKVIFGSAHTILWSNIVWTVETVQLIVAPDVDEYEAVVATFVVVVFLLCYVGLRCYSVGLRLASRLKNFTFVEVLYLNLLEIFGIIHIVLFLARFYMWFGLCFILGVLFFELNRKKMVKESMLVNSKPFNMIRAQKSTIGTGYGPAQCFGLGVVFKQGYALVTWHQINPDKYDVERNKIIWPDKKGILHVSKFTVIFVDENLDIAVITCPIGPKVCTLAAGKVGMHVTMFCNDGPTPIFHDKVGSITAGKLCKVYGGTVYHENTSFEGQSGSPMFFGLNCIALHKEGSSKYGGATIMTTELIAKILSLGVTKESYEIMDVNAAIEALVARGYDETMLRVERTVHGDNYLYFSLYDNNGRKIREVEWTDGEWSVGGDNGVIEVYDDLFNMLETELDIASASKYNAGDAMKGVGSGGGHRSSKRTSRGNQKTGPSRKAQKTRSGYTDKSKSRKRQQTVNLNKKFSSVHAGPADINGQPLFSNVVRLEPQGDFMNDQKDPSVDPEDIKQSESEEEEGSEDEVDEYDTWEVVGNLPHKHFPQREMVFNERFRDAFNMLTDGERTTYAYAPTDVLTLKRCFKKYADVEITPPGDLDLWLKFFRNVIPEMGPKSDVKHKIRSVDEAWNVIVKSKTEVKACGAPFNTKESPCKNAHQSKIDVHNCSICWGVIKGAIEDVLEGREVKTDCPIELGDVNPKPEFLKKKKIDEGRTRMVICANMVQILLQVMLSAGFSSVKEACYDGWNRIGMTVSRGGMQMLRRRLQGLRYKREMDYGHFDLTQLGKVQHVCADIISDIYGFDLDDARTRRGFDAVKEMVSGEKLWRLDDEVLRSKTARFNSSGNQWTGEINGVYNVCATIYAAFDEVPTSASFYEWFYNTGSHMNKYGDDSLDGSRVAFRSKSETVRRLTQFGISITEDDIKDSTDINGMSFLGFVFDDSRCGVSFSRWTKSVMNLVYAKNDDYVLFGAIQSLLLNAAGNQRANGVARELAKAVKAPEGQLYFSDDFIVSFWTGKEDLLDTKGFQPDHFDIDDDGSTVCEYFRPTQSKQSVIQTVPEGKYDKVYDFKISKLPTSSGQQTNGEMVRPYWTPDGTSSPQFQTSQFGEFQRQLNEINRILGENRGKAFEQNDVKKESQQIQGAGSSPKKKNKKKRKAGRKEVAGSGIVVPNRTTVSASTA